MGLPSSHTSAWPDVPATFRWICASCHKPGVTAVVLLVVVLVTSLVIPSWPVLLSNRLNSDVPLPVRSRPRITGLAPRLTTSKRMRR